MRSTRRRPTRPAHNNFLGSIQDGPVSTLTEISEEVLEMVVSRTKGVSAAFIKELMRRCAQFQIESSHGNILTQQAVDAAMEEMLFTGGALNRRLLGGEGAEQSANQVSRFTGYVKRDA